MAKSTLEEDMKKIDQLINSEMGLGAEQTRSQEERLARIAANDQTRIERFKAAVLRKESKGHRVAVDFGGGIIAQASTELMNYGIRALGDWSKNGFFAHNVDLLQGMPHFVLGLGIYFAEMLTRTEPKGGGEWVTPTREVISEATKIFAQLGFSNPVRAIRVRWNDSNKREVAYQAVAQEKAQREIAYQAIAKEKAQLEAKLAQLQGGAAKPA